MPNIQERTLDGHKIERIGRGHYLCKSRSRPSIHYAVDLQANEGLGHCEVRFDTDDYRNGVKSA
jgi:hypothetical protein